MNPLKGKANAQNAERKWQTETTLVTTLATKLANRPKYMSPMWWPYSVSKKPNLYTFPPGKTSRQITTTLRRISEGPTDAKMTFLGSDPKRDDFL